MPFCFNKGFNKCVYRNRPFEYCLEEISFSPPNGVWTQSILREPGVGMTGNDSQLEFVKQRDFKIPWGATQESAFIKGRLCVMFRAGCRWIFFGVESGSQEIQDRIHKGIDINKVEDTVRH
jgi:hypothetical protein